MFFTIIRIILTTVLLVIVSKNAHWSVTLLLSLQFVTNELSTLIMKQHNKVLTGLTSILGKIRTDMKSRWN
jgi:hypothetical protein